MSTFINTVEALSDSTLTKNIISRTVTNYKDNIATRVGKCAFRRCLLLAVVDMPNITYIDENAFNECSALTALIIRRTDSVVTLANANALANTPIAGGTGYIYVPSALVDAYKADTEWSVYASQIRAIEDYPQVCDPYSWDVVFQCIEDGTYKDYYKIGDTISLYVDTIGTFDMEIAAFDTDDLADGSGKAPISWLSVPVIIKRRIMNPALITSDDGTYQEGTGAIGGWEKSEMRSYYINTLKSLILETVKNRIKPVIKTQYAVDISGTRYLQTTIDDVWIPSSSEHNSKYVYKKQKLDLGNSGAYYWLRDNKFGNNSQFVYADTGGSANYGLASSSTASATVLGFCT